MMTFLTGKTALVTGATSGIGLAIAHALAQAGAHVAFNGFGEKSLVEKIEREFQTQYGCQTAYSAANLKLPEEIQTMILQFEQSIGPIDILVNNAGIQFVAPVTEFPQDKWQDILAINLSAAFTTTQLVLPKMLKNNWGRIINIASAHGLVASPFKSAYVAAKHGLVGLTKVVALETAEANITCNALCPGYVKTPLVEKQISEQAKAHQISEERVVKDILLKAQPNKKFIQAEHLAQMVVFLCSPAGEGMTGQIISMDGGWTAQ